MSGLSRGQILSTIIQKDQKGFLSNGKFIHLELGVMSLEFEANLYRSENRHGSVALLKKFDWGYWAQTYVALLGPGIDPEVSKIKLRDRIVQYTKRQLSYSQDSLNSFLGIFADYEQQQAGLVSTRRSRPEVPSVLSSPLNIVPQPSHIWGLPLQLGAMILEWYHPLPPKQRRSYFPSWSWTGWEGGVEFKDNCWWLHSSSEPTFVPTSIEMPNQLRGLHDRKIKGLYVTGATVELKFATQEQTQSIIEGMKRHNDTRNFPNYDVQTPCHHCLLEAFPGVFVAVRSTMPTKPAPQDQIIGLLVTFEADNCFGARSMIVLKQCGQSFTRISFIDVDDL